MKASVLSRRHPARPREVLKGALSQKLSRELALLAPDQIRSALIVAPHGLPWLSEISGLFVGIPRPQTITVLTEEGRGIPGGEAQSWTFRRNRDGGISDGVLLWWRIFRNRFQLVLLFVEHDPEEDPIAVLRLACFPAAHRFLCRASPARCQRVTIPHALKTALSHPASLVRQLYFRWIYPRAVFLIDLFVRAASRAFVPVWETICWAGGRRRLKSLDKVRRILLIALDNPGDLLLATPCLTALKDRFPSAKLTVLAGQWGQELLSGRPEVFKVIVYHPPWFEKYVRHLPHKAPRPVRDFLSCVAALWRERFDLTVDTRGEAAHIVLAYLSGASHRAGYALRSNVPGLKAQRLAHLLTHEVPFDWSRWHRWHKVDYNLQVIAALGAASTNHSLELRIPAQAATAAEDLLKAQGILEGELLIGVFPGASREEKRWSLSLFAQVLDRLVNEWNAKVVVIGSLQEYPLAQELAGRMVHPPIVLAGRTTLLEAAALIRQCRILICNDSAATHIASAVGTPVVSVSRAPAHFYAPLRIPGTALTHRLPCMNVGQADGCHCPFSEYWCLQAVTPEEVIRAAQELLRKDVYAHRN
ncbi:MAG: glycosyltransferase family 9 protein [Candidatus Omnitrophica bacterium]|nr:glycosyltransferase family 9 protein [Candidatus Omnitrophota bacterium]